jgi:hypothetical protein
MWRFVITCIILITVWSCGPTQRALTTEQAATATAVSAFATFEALPADIKAATQTAVAEKIKQDLP